MRTQFESADESCLKSIELSLDGSTGKSILLSRDNALLYLIPLCLCSRVELAAAENVKPCTEGRICFNKCADSGVDSGEEAFHGDPAYVVLRIVEEFSELADGFVTLCLVGSGLIFEGHDTVHNTDGGRALAFICRDICRCEVDAAALVSNIGGELVGGDDHSELAGSEHILQVITSLGCRAGVGVALVDEADCILNSLYVLRGVDSPVAVSIDESAAVAPSVPPLPHV